MPGTKKLAYDLESQEVYFEATRGSYGCRDATSEPA